MRIFKTKPFLRWATKNSISDDSLSLAAAEIAKGVFDASLGGYVFKKRIATKGRGKSGSARTIIAFKQGGDCFFIYGFEKNEKSNITNNELKALKIVAKQLLGLLPESLESKLKTSKLIEVSSEQE